jgi:hypothetical protein
VAIPEAQLETWSQQGPTAQFTSTYDSIRNVLWDTSSPYATRDVSVFLQGSYKNYTNIYGDSDVDIVICTGAVYYSDTSNLSADEKRRFEGGFSLAQYDLSHFKNDVVGWLNKKYPNMVTVGNKAVCIKGNAGRRDADVVIAAEFRRYYGYPAEGTPTYETGICFFASDGTRIENFPKQHTDNCTSKNQSTNWFKKTVRTYKNLRKAVAAFREALRSTKRERVPLDWAILQNNLGGALQILGQREAGTAKLEEAVAAFREALKVRTREREPLDWAVRVQ